MEDFYLDKKPVYLSLYDNFTKEGIIPNGFNMSIDEYNKHRWRIAGPSNVKFTRNVFLDHHVQEVPIHADSIINYPKVLKENVWFRHFKKKGRIVYTINLSPSADSFPELFQYGMNHFMSFLDPKILKLISEGNAKLIISCLNEKCDAYEIWRIINNIVMQDGLGKSSAELWTPWRMIDPDNKLPLASRDVPMYETLVMRDLGEVLHAVQPYRKRTKKFISLCRRYQPERIAAFMFLLANGLDKEGYVSMPSKSVNEPYSDLYTEAKNGSLHNTPLVKFPFVEEVLQNHSDKISQDYVLDGNPVTEEKRAIYNKDNLGFGFKEEQSSLVEYYEDSYLSLIQEGDAYDQRQSYMITEKTIRAMMCNHMFVMIGPPFLLKSLQLKGYKTFGDLWDESYDLIKNDEERLKKSLNIFKEVVEGDIETLYKKATPIIMHNKNHIFKRIEEFRETL